MIIFCSEIIPSRPFLTARGKKNILYGGRACASICGKRTCLHRNLVNVEVFSSPPDQIPFPFSTVLRIRIKWSVYLFEGDQSNGCVNFAIFSIYYPKRRRKATGITETEMDG